MDCCWKPKSWGRLGDQEKEHKQFIDQLGFSLNGKTDFKIGLHSIIWHSGASTPIDYGMPAFSLNLVAGVNHLERLITGVRHLP